MSQKGKIVSVLKGCKKCFGCGGSTGGEGSKDSIILQGDQTDNLKKPKEALLDGLEIRFADKQFIFILLGFNKLLK